MMRMIDRFRTPTECKIITALEKIKLGTAHDIAVAIGFNSPNHNPTVHHMGKLVDADIVHVCGHIGVRNRPVYALIRKEADE